MGAAPRRRSRSAARTASTGAVIGMVVAQVVATAAISIAGVAAFRRFPSAPVRAARRGAPRRCGASSSPSTLASSLVSARATLGTALLADGRADRPGRLLPQRAGAGDRASRRSPAPARLVLLTEQTRDFEAGRHDRGVRACSAATSSARRRADGRRRAGSLVADAVPHGPRVRRRRSASTRRIAARLVLVAAALQLVFGWTKSFPVSIGRPGPADRRAQRRDRRVRPAAARLRRATGARPARAAALLVSTVVFCALWIVLLWRASAATVPRARGGRDAEGSRRLRNLAARRRRARVARAGGRGVPAARGHEVEAVITADAPPAPRRLSRALGRRARCRRASATPTACASWSRARAARRRRLHDRHVRPLVARRARSRATPFVVKLTADPAYERARRLGPLARLARGVPGTARRRRAAPFRARTRLRRAPRGARRHARRAYLRELAIGWGVPAGARRRCSRTRRPRCPSCGRATSCAASSASTARRSSFAGRLTAQKSLDVGDRGGAPRRGRRS